MIQWLKNRLKKKDLSKEEIWEKYRIVRTVQGAYNVVFFMNGTTYFISRRDEVSGVFLAEDYSTLEEAQVVQEWLVLTHGRRTHD